VQEELFASPNPRLAGGLETLAYLVHPDRFAASGGPHLSPIDGVRPYCAPGQMPAFSFGFGVLAESLGTNMGEPTECAHAEVASGSGGRRGSNERHRCRAGAWMPAHAAGGSASACFRSISTSLTIVSRFRSVTDNRGQWHSSRAQLRTSTRSS